VAHSSAPSLPTDDTDGYTSGGNLQTEAVICDGQRTVYKHENEDMLQAHGRYNSPPDH
jgi:hypothetical protein